MKVMEENILGDEDIYKKVKVVEDTRKYYMKKTHK